MDRRQQNVPVLRRRLSDREMADFGDRATVPAALLDSVVAGPPLIPIGEATELGAVEGMRAFVQAVGAQA